MTVKSAGAGELESWRARQICLNSGAAAAAAAAAVHKLQQTLQPRPAIDKAGPEVRMHWLLGMGLFLWTMEMECLATL